MKNSFKHKLTISHKLYLGDIEAYYHYLLSVKFKSLSTLWIDCDSHKSTDNMDSKVIRICGDSEWNPLGEKTIRNFKNCPSFYIGDAEFLESQEDVELLNIKHSCGRLIPNPQYMTFEKYTEIVLGKPLKDPEKLTDLPSVNQAQQYVEMITAYHEDSCHSWEKKISYYPSISEEYVMLVFDGLHSVTATLWLNEGYYVTAAELNFKRESKLKEGE